MSGVLAIVQARMSSARLPGKTLADVEGEPMLTLLLRRLARATTIERIVVATSDEAVDDPIVPVAEAAGVETFRGSRDDVLSRFAGAAGAWDGPVARVTGDCPLIDPGVVDAVAQLWAADSQAVYASNLDPPCYPDGLDVEVFSAQALREISESATDASDREHVTTAIRRAPERFPAAALAGDTELARLRWTVDLPDDLAFVRAVARLLGPLRWTAPHTEILAAIRADPELRSQPGRAFAVATVDRR